MTTNANGLIVGIGFDIAARSANNRELQRDHWQALIVRIDNVVDYVTLEDGFARAEGDGLDAVLLANWLAPRSRNIGIIAGAPVNFLEPFHVDRNRDPRLRERGKGRTACAAIWWVTDGTGETNTRRA